MAWGASNATRAVQAYGVTRQWVTRQWTEKVQVVQQYNMHVTQAPQEIQNGELFTNEIGNADLWAGKCR